MKKYSIAKEYTTKPGPREEKLGKFSGKNFRETVLYKMVIECFEKNEKLEINLDGVYGYPESFLEESFGGLIRNHNINKDKLLHSLVLVCTEDSTTIEKILQYIKEAKVVEE